MIIRNNRINPNTSEVQIKLSYSLPDIKDFLKRYFTTFYSPQVSEVGLNHLLTDTITEREFRATMEKAEWCFGNYENPWRNQLSAWLWNQVVKNEFVTPSGTSTTVFFFTDKALSLVKVERKRR